MKPQLKPAVMAAITRQQSLLYLTLILGHEIFAWDGMQVREVLDHESMIEMAGMPSFICGGVYWKGEAVPVVDLEARMTRRTTPVTKYTRIVIMEMMQGRNRQLLGVLMNPLSRAYDGLRSATDLRGALASADPACEDDGEVPARIGAPPRRSRQTRQPCMIG